MVALTVLSGCGSSNDDSADTATAASSSPNATAGDADGSDGGAGEPAATSLDVAEPPSTQADVGAPADTQTSDSAEASTEGSDTNPAIDALASLEPAAVCALAPQAEVEAITGVSVSAGDGLMIDGLGTNCMYSDFADSLRTVAKIEFTTLSFDTSSAMLAYGLTPGDWVDGSVGGSPSVEFAGDDIVDPTVIVQLGTPADLALTVNAVDVSAARAVAELVLTNLAL